MSRIDDLPLYFNLIRRYVLFMFKRYYGDFIIIGKENIPDNVPLIFAPNHINAIMDALVVHTVIPRNLPLIFLARADIFRNKTAARFLGYAKILPAFRMRDGIENLGNNTEIFNQCIEILHNNNALGIMPEGNQEIEHKLRPLVKGIFRIAFAAQQQYGIEPGVKIVPVGIDYGDIFKANKHIIINIGKPIEVSDYVNSYSTNPVKATNEIRDRLRKDLSDLTLNLATNSYYNCFEIVVEVVQNPLREVLGLKDDNTYNRFIARQEVAKRLVELEKNKPDELERLDKLSSEYQRLLSQLNLKTKIIENANPDLLKFILETVFLMIGLPIFILGFILNFLPFSSPVLIRKYIFKAQYEGFFSSLQFGLGIITFPVFYLIQTVLFWIFISSSSWAILLLFFAQYPLGKLALSWNKTIRKYLANIQYLKFKYKKTIQLKELKTLYNQIVETVLSSK